MKAQVIKTTIGPALLVTCPRGVFAVNCRPNASRTHWMRAQQLGAPDKLPGVPCATLGAALALGRVVLS